MTTTTLSLWIQSSRPKTWVAGICPVLIGASFTSRQTNVSLVLFSLCLLFSLFLQIGANWANDYYDFIKGADTASRKGPPRATQKGWIAPLAMRNGAFFAMGSATLLAIPLLAQLPSSYIFLMIAAILSAHFYTAGKWALGYLGLGDLLVMVFYGPVAVCCTAIVLGSSFSLPLFCSSLAPGFLSCAILTINNYRDVEEDRLCGKMTLVARFGSTFGRYLYLIYVFASADILFILVAMGYSCAILLPLFSFIFAIEPIRIVWTRPEELNRALALTARLLAIYTLLFCYAMVCL